MKIAVPVEGLGNDTTVSASFGRAAGFLVYDDDQGTTDILNNDAAQSAGGAGIWAAQTVVDSGAKILLTPQCGGNAAKVLLAAGVKLYKTQPGVSASENIKRFLRGELTELSEIHEGFHGH